MLARPEVGGGGARTDRRAGGGQAAGGQSSVSAASVAEVGGVRGQKSARKTRRLAITQSAPVLIEAAPSDLRVALRTDTGANRF